MKVELIPIRVKRQGPKFDFVKTVLGAIKRNGQYLQDGDILVISSKFVSMSENRIVNLSKVKVGRAGKKLAGRLDMDPRLAQLVVDESDAIFSGVPGFALAIKNGVIAPNAGIDKSNIFPGYVILYPEDPYASAQMIRKRVLKIAGKKVGVILCDSRLMPTRIGTTGVALTVSGIQPVKDERGRKDLFGNVLRVTQRAIADDLSSAAQVVMGEADEGIPVVIARGTEVQISNNRINPSSMSVPFEQCIYITGLTDRETIEKMKKIKRLPS